MSSPPISTSVGTTLSSGIQDISALLPLLGTDQCENHIGSGLEQGFLYPAATTLSVFGSLGTARAGLKTLVASINIRHFNFIGARILRDSGFGVDKKNCLSAIVYD